jgi:hypothetical protein
MQDSPDFGSVLRRIVAKLGVGTMPCCQLQLPQGKGAESSEIAGGLDTRPRTQVSAQGPEGAVVDPPMP